MLLSSSTPVCERVHASQTYQGDIVAGLSDLTAGYKLLMALCAKTSAPVRPGSGGKLTVTAQA